MQQRHNNNFDFLRFFAASSIIISHSFALTLGYSKISMYDPSLLFGQSGLAILLVISGYLISQSWENKPELFRFFWKRCVRIIPGMVISILFVILFIGPLATTLNPVNYIESLLSPATWSAFPFYKDGFPIGIFTDNPVTFVNAPLWVIPAEFVLYALVALFGILGLLKNKFSILPLIFLDIYLWIIWYDNGVLNKVHFIIYFLIGIIFYQNKEHIEYKNRTALCAAGVLAATLFFHTNTPVIFIAAFATVPYLILYIAHLPIKRLNNFGKYGDFSYGMFIYSYPVQQTLVHFWPGEISIPLLCILSLSIAVLLGALSWKFIESRALKLKNIEF